MPRYTKHSFQVGEWWLSQRSGSPAWYATCYDAATQRTRRVSLGTDDFEQARQRLLVVHPLSCCGIWHDGDPGAARGAVPPSAAPDEGMLVRVPVRGGTLDGFFDLGPGFEAAPFEGQRA